MTHNEISTRALILQRNPHDRRNAQPGLPPPYWNAEGLVLVDRRENSERRTSMPQQRNIGSELITESANIATHTLAAEPQVFMQHGRVAA